MTAALVVVSAVLGSVLDLAWIAGSAGLALYLVLAFFPTLALAARRLHDVGRSSLWVAVAAVPPFALVVLYWCVLPGEAGPNVWGQPTDA